MERNEIPYFSSLRLSQTNGNCSIYCYLLSSFSEMFDKFLQYVPMYKVKLCDAFYITFHVISVFIFICINAVIFFFFFLTIFLLLTLSFEFFNRPTISHVYNLMAVNCTIKVENAFLFSCFVSFNTKPSIRFTVYVCGLKRHR